MTYKHIFQKRLSESTFLIMTHRGFWGGNIIQNTTQSAQLAYAAGSDMVEVDVCRSSDGVYYLFHDGGELDLLGVDQPFWELSSEFIDSVSVLNTLGNPSGYRVQRFEEFLAWLPEGSLVNIDRSWHYFDDSDFFDIVHASGKGEWLLFKSPVADTWLTGFEENAGGLAYMPIVYSVDEVVHVLNRRDLNTVGVEIVAKSADSELLEADLLRELKHQGLFIMANAEKLGEQFNLFAGFDDDYALLDSLNSGWLEFIRRGIDVVQTDWPNFLNQFRKEYKLADIDDLNRVIYKDYNGLVDPEKLRPLLGESYMERAEFKHVIALVNQWKLASAFNELAKLERVEDTVVDALRFKAEMFFVYEDHLSLMEVVDELLTLRLEDLQALWLGTLSRLAKGEVGEAREYLRQLEKYHPEWASKLRGHLKMLEDYSDYSAVVSDMDAVETLDVIAIYGFGLTEAGEIPQILERRLQKGLELLSAFKEAKVIVSGGAVTNPFNEAEAMAAYLLEHGVEKERVILEPFAKDTVGNSVMIAQIMEELGFESCCVVTSITHLPRAYMSLVGALDAIAYPMEVYGAGGESVEIDLPLNEKRLAYSTLFRSMNLYRKKDLESGGANDVNI